MAKGNFPVTSFNHGEVSKLSLARVDLSRLRFAAEIQKNYVPRTVGPMTMRPGLAMIDRTKNDAEMMPIPFVFSVDNQDTAIIEMYAGAMRFRVGDELVTRATVNTHITGGTFPNLSAWTVATNGDATAAAIGGHLYLTAVGLGSWVTVTQTVAVNPAYTATEHAVRINVSPLQGPVRFRIGTTSGDDDVLAASDLGSGEHSLAFTPGAGLIYVQFESRKRHSVIIDNISIEGAGTLEIANGFVSTDLPLLRWTQSADVVYLASGKRQFKIERRSTTSWSLVQYLPDDGPFKPLATADVKLTPSDTKGNITMASDVNFFRPSMVGTLFRINASGQRQTSSISADDTFTDPVRVSGVHNPDNFAAGGRVFQVTIAGSFVGTLSLQRSFDAPDTGYETVDTFTGADSGQTFAIVDEFDNSIAWYRIGFEAGNYTSGTAVVTLNYGGSAPPGIVRITSYFSPTSVGANVLKDLSRAVATKDWQEGEWSDHYGWPTTVDLFEGRLWWMGHDRFWGSASDAYESFDITIGNGSTTIGDSASIQRSIGYGPVEKISWSLALQRLLVGTGYSEIAARSSSFDEPLTPTNFALRDASTQGSSRVAAVKVDGRGVFVTRSKRRLYQLLFAVENGDYTSNDLTALLPDLGTNIIKLGVQRHPDTRIHAILADGTAKVLLFEPSEEVICWYSVETDGEIESVVVLPESIEDRVYYVIKRTINDVDYRFIEKYARLDQCTGLPESRIADSHIVYSGSSTTTISGLDHLEGEEVVAWGWDNSDTQGTDFATAGSDPPRFTVTDGEITLPVAKENACVGLPYEARFKSAKLAYAAAAGTALAQPKRIDHLALILQNTHLQGIKFGGNFDRLDWLPRMYRGATLAADHIFTDHDVVSIGVPGKWDTDERLCLISQAPRPVTVLGAVISLTTHDKV
jgi:hypothetical protein